MQVVFRLPVDATPHMKLLQSPWTGSSRVFVDGAEVPSQRKGRVRHFQVQLRDGTQAELQLKNSVVDILPRATLVHGQPPTTSDVHLARQLVWWEYLLCGLPLLLVPAGGVLGGAVLGGLIGAFAAYANLRLMRSDLAAPLRALATLGVLVVATALYVVLVGVLSLAILGGR